MEHCLDSLRVMRLGQGELKQDTCLLRVQRVTIDEVLIDIGLLSRYDSTRTYTRAADDDNPFLCALASAASSAL